MANRALSDSCKRVKAYAMRVCQRCAPCNLVCVGTSVARSTDSHAVQHGQRIHLSVLQVTARKAYTVHHRRKVMLRGFEQSDINSALKCIRHVSEGSVAAK
ncbi:hypothetical protein NPIL_371131 [Nephila pilipes]|uniref:Uncharacterized protein n=1 Tax=Nephila pilipes TaxID=299642 RepID=A0A8X6TJX6_NEPPI|nr:hypothetical protein NPIL_371131 [Nephila pilipes]